MRAGRVIMQWQRSVLVSVLAVWCLVLFVWPVTLGAAEGKIEVKMVGTLPIQHHLTKALEMYRDIVQKQSENRVTFQLYPAQQLYNDKDIVSALPKGAVEGAILNPDLWSGLVPSQGILYFSCYFPSREKFFKLWDTPAWPIVAKDFEDRGVKILSQIEYGSMSGLSKKPISKMEDIKNLRIRANGEYIAIFLRALGAAPVVTSSSEVYLMLQRGTIDGTWSGPSSFVDRKWYEVAKYYLDTDTHVSSTFLLGLNAQFWKKLPPDLQKIFSDAAIEVQNWTRKFSLEADVSYRKILKEKGLTFTSLDSKEWERWRTRVAPELESAYKKAVGQEKAQKVIDTVRQYCF
jgi:TRAP-type C4-dicarboxylate transport system substrate-binding protein